MMIYVNPKAVEPTELQAILCRLWFRGRTPATAHRTIDSAMKDVDSVSGNFSIHFPGRDIVWTKG